MSAITLIDEIAQLTAERDALELRIGAMIVERSDAFFKVIQERDALQSELDLARRKLAVLSNADALENLYQVGLKQEFDITALTKERDALKEAAKLALDALEAAISNDRRPYLVKSEEAIAALKAVLK